ncbi:hypothetical protein DFR49_4372 [Hephaestia caeni]|uniref:WD40 repeat protein n=1 Tax=Hephaestia caeni TaxID=645617 RepID=A0A397NNY1_9SPHN|nr:hypothetical protein [Hephaestia caeni]RIA35354.1 hypothetical protein DFR49_4372 [Hephaestia caeni]
MIDPTFFERFPAYTQFGPAVPVVRVSPDGLPAIHRFYDTSPVSPSGRYVAMLRFPFENRLPSPGDEAEVLVVDLKTGEIAYRTPTAAWDTQVGAHVQWGASDKALFFNRIDKKAWQAYGVRVNILTGEECALAGTVYMISPDGRYSATPCLEKIGLVQLGYGAHIPDLTSRENRGAPADDGLFLVDTQSGKSRLLLSFSEMYDQLRHHFKNIKLDNGGFYGFHAKWNPAGDRILFIVRWRKDGSRRYHTQNFLLSIRPDGTDLTMAIDAVRWRAGHHPNWCPDGEHVVMNLSGESHQTLSVRIALFAARAARKLRIPFRPSIAQLRFMTFRYDGSEMRVIAPLHMGSGHPTMHRDGVHLLTDAYPSEPVSYGDGTVPLRLVSIETGNVENIIRIRTLPIVSGRYEELRVDPHPAWDASGRYLVFNGCPDGTRAVFVADMAALVGLGETKTT